MTEEYFHKYRQGIIGINQTFFSPYGEKKIVYTDWTASGRLYKPIEDTLSKNFFPIVGNTHSESSFTGRMMTESYHEAHYIIKKHVNAGKDDVIITYGTGMTGAVNKLQRILGLKVPEQVIPHLKISENDKPVVFVTHM